MAEEEPKTLSTSVKDNLNNLKYHLEGWREILIPVHSVLVWKLPHYPLIVWVVITFVFCLLYYLQLSVLTTLAIVGIVVVVADYSVPILQARWADPQHWDGVKERKFEDVCYGILCVREHCYNCLEHVAEMKRTKPSMYFAGTLACLLLLAWLGLVMNNLFLTYILACGVAMIPGLAHRGYLQKYLKIECSKLNSSRTKKQN